MSHRAGRGAAGAVVFALVWLAAACSGGPTGTAIPAASPSAAAITLTTTVSTPSTASSAAAVPSETPAPLPTPVASAEASSDLDALARFMMTLVNQDRQNAGLSPVEWDDTAALAGREHAEEMAANGYLSHWDLQGRGPELRYWSAGGRDAVRENVYSYYQRYQDGQPAPIENWPEAIERAEQTLMDSPPHRENILQGYHTHVGIGVAYNASTGELRIAQEFVDRYVAMDDLPATISAGETITVSGRLLLSATSPLINLAFEAFPTPMSAEQLRRTGTYESAAKVYQAITPSTEDHRFAAPIHFTPSDGPGLYHIRTWITQNGEHILASDLIPSVH